MMGFAAAAYAVPDPALKELRWRSHVVEVEAPNKILGRMRNSVHQLTADEKACLQAVVSLFSLDLHPAVFDMLSPQVRIDDPWFLFSGNSELMDAFAFLRTLSAECSPAVLSVSRSADDPSLLLCEVEIVFRPALWFPGVTPPSLKMPSHVAVLLGREGTSRTVVRSIVHRWFGGSIYGRISRPDNWLAPFWEAPRRVNGVLLGLMSRRLPHEA